MNAAQVYITGASLALHTDLKDLVKSDGADHFKAQLGGKQAGDVSCEPDLWVSFFFDGTRNNMANDLPSYSHSNVARLYRAHIGDDPSAILFREYFSGVGTLFEDKIVTGRVDKGSDTFGAGLAAGGTMRLECAMERMKRRIQDAENQSPTGFLKKIHVAIFGFSRGAALARAFAQMLVKECRYNQFMNQWFWGAGRRQHAFEIYFMGLFDTVASVGTPTSLRGWSTMLKKSYPLTSVAGPVLGIMASEADGHSSWAEDLRIPPAPLVQKCLHLVAAHECRKSFPLDLVLEGARLPGNCREIIYPGVHSDVGGGYWPGEQGRGKLGIAGDGQKLSQIPLFDMYKAAWEAGVPLRHPASNKGKNAWAPENSKDFILDVETKNLYNNYLLKLSNMLTPGCQSSLQSWIEAHMGTYFRWRATVLDQPPLADNTGRAEKGKKEYTDGVNTLNKSFKDETRKAHSEWLKGKLGDKPYRRILAEAYEVYMREHAQLVEASMTQPPDTQVCQFFQTRVHDSAAEFAGTMVDGSRLHIPRVFYVGKDDQAKIAKNQGMPEEGTLAAV